MTVLATAGHVDHGKSTLVRALTGTDPDRWAEEKARGLTIDLGFAALALDGREISLVDVPGHVRFLRNMLAGVGAVSGVIFVVAATEGWKPQSEEHLRILQLLGLRRGVVALTKVDQVDDDLRELAELELADHLAGTFLEDAPIVGCAAPTGEGLEELRAAIGDLAAAGDDTAGDRTRLWVDRVFAPAGAGTVVTGTLLGGSVALGDHLVAVPGDHEVRVRGIQSHHREVDALAGGHRCALALAGVSHSELGRGAALVEPHRWHHTDRFDAELTVLDAIDHEVSRRGAYACYVGSAELAVRLRILGPEALLPGDTGAVRLFADRPLPLVPGDRFVLREQGRDETVGGGTVLDVDPVLRASRARPDRSVARVVAERGWVDHERLQRLTGVVTPPDVGRWVVDPDALVAAVGDLAGRIDAAGAIGLDLARLDERERAVLDRVDGVTVDETRVVGDDFVDPLADHPWVDELAASPFTPPSADGVDRTEVRELVRRGLVIESDGVHFAPSAIAELARRLADHFDAHPEGITVAEVRDLADTTRKYTLALLGHFDRNGLTRRRDDVRIEGPRLRAAAEG